jgi:hypothetical protein
MTKLAFSLISLAVGCLLPGSSSAYEMSEYDTLTIKFHLPPATRPDLHPTDTVYLAIEPPASGTATQALAQLFNGNILLGSNLKLNATESPTGFPFYFYWTDQNSNFSSQEATQINGATLANRTIDGSIKVSFNGTLQFSDFGFDAGNGWLSSIGIEGGNHAIVDSIEITRVSPVPEPATFAYAIAGFALLGMLARPRLL